MINKYRIREVRDTFCVDIEVDETKQKQTGFIFCSRWETVDTGKKIWKILDSNGRIFHTSYSVSFPEWYSSKEKAIKAVEKFKEWDKKGTVIHEVE